MANTVYQLEFISEDETRKESKVYSDLLNLIWSLEQEGYKQESSHLLKGYNEEGKEELVVVHTLTHYEGRKLPKEDNEDSALSELVVLLSELVYDDLTKEERDDKKLKVFEKATDAKKELEDREEK
ncbi:hypothetical protein YN120080_20 [Staphylococcus phage vB_SauM_JDYN]|nr:hypothetical protein YN120080_20 [Staphylococcus phage vB_SauM_JDYN]